MDDLSSLTLSLSLSSNQDEHDSLVRKAITKLKEEFARIINHSIEATLQSSQEPEVVAEEIGLKLAQMLDTLASVKANKQPEVCRICLEPVPADTRYAILEACDHAHCEPCLRGWIAESHNLDLATLRCPTCRVVSSRVLFHETFLTSVDKEKSDKLNAVIWFEHSSSFHWIDVNPISENVESIRTDTFGSDIASTPRGNSVLPMQDTSPLSLVTRYSPSYRSSRFGWNRTHIPSTRVTSPYTSGFTRYSSGYTTDHSSISSSSSLDSIHLMPEAKQAEPQEFED